MKKIINITLILSMIFTSTIYAETGVIEDRDFKFKENRELDENIRPFNLPKFNPPSSLLDTHNKLTSARENSRLPGTIEYVSKESMSLGNSFLSSNKSNGQLKSEGIIYNEKYTTNDLVYTGYTFNNGLIFPIDLRKDRTAGIPKNKIKPKGKSASGLTVTSPTGFRSLDGIEFHNGTDYSGGIGETGNRSNHNYYAPIDAKVVYAGVGNGYGNIVVMDFKLKDEYNYRYAFAHLENGSIPEYVKAGLPVSQGQYIGRMGGSGGVPNHLHWEAIRYKYIPSDPMQAYPPAQSNSGSSKLFSYNPSNKSATYIANSKNKKAQAIPFEPTKLYGNYGSGKQYMDWYKKIGILVSRNSAPNFTSKLPFYQGPHGKNIKEVPWAEPRNYSLK